MNKDVHGVFRGRCNQCTTCDGFRPPENGIRCAACTHPPGKHVRLNENGEVDVTSLPTGITSGAKDIDQGSSRGPPGGFTSDHSTGRQARQDPPLPRLPKCKSDACTNSVHYDPLYAHYGRFEYCSPACRDAHLLEEERKKLKMDIEDYEKKLKQLPPSKTKVSGAVSNGVKSSVSITKSSGGELGIIICKNPVIEGCRSKLMVTGVVKRSPAYQHLKDGNLKLLSVITSVCGTEVGELMESFHEHILPLTIVELGLDTSRALSVDSLPGYGSHCVTHIFALLPVDGAMPRKKGTSDVHVAKAITAKFGVELGSCNEGSTGIQVAKVIEGGVADLGGINKDDAILSVTAGQDRTDAHDKGKFESILINACLQNTAVVLFVRRE